jgi:tetratricopeptide (TPR) repeat protein
MEHLAKHESGASWIHIENELANWAGQRYIDKELSRLPVYESTSQVIKAGMVLPNLVYFISIGRWEHLKKHLGPNHPKTLTALANYAYVFGNIGNWGAAEQLEQEVLERRRNALPESHPDTLVAMANLAWTYWNRGRFVEAAKLEIEVLQARIKILGVDHVDTLTAMANLAGTNQKLGNRDEAEILESKVLEGRRRILGDNHRHTNNYGIRGRELSLSREIERSRSTKYGGAGKQQKKARREPP